MRPAPQLSLWTHISEPSFPVVAPAKEVREDSGQYLATALFQTVVKTTTIFQIGLYEPIFYYALTVLLILLSLG